MKNLQTKICRNECLQNLLSLRAVICRNECVGLVDGNLVQKVTSGPDILRLMGRDKRFSPRILDHGSGFCSLSNRIREKQLRQEGRLN